MQLANFLSERNKIGTITLAFELDVHITAIFRRDVPKMLLSLRDRIQKFFIMTSPEHKVHPGLGLVGPTPKKNPPGTEATKPITVESRIQNKKRAKILLRGALYHTMENVSHIFNKNLKHILIYFRVG